LKGETKRIEGIGTVSSVGELNLKKLVEQLLKSSLVHGIKN
jgi:hypothetical protein